MTAFAERLDGRSAITVSAYVGQDLRDWRPGRDHRTTASATQQAGGGVLRDLSHELDYLLWLFGPWQRVAALGGSSGARQVDVDDHLDLLLQMTRSQTVHVHMDYLDRSGIRRIRVNLPEETIEADILGGRLTVNGKAHEYPSARDESYKSMHLAAIDGRGPICTLRRRARRHGSDRRQRTRPAVAHVGIGMRSICTICARGGSKGVVGKNARELLGKPLLAWTIEQAKADRAVRSDRIQQRLRSAVADGVAVGRRHRRQAPGRDGDRYRPENSRDTSLPRTGRSRAPG